MGPIPPPQQTLLAFFSSNLDYVLARGQQEPGVEGEEDLQVVLTCFSLGGMAPYSYSASVLSD